MPTLESLFTTVAGVPSPYDYITQPVEAITPSGGTATMDNGAYNVFSLTVGSNTTIAHSNLPSEGTRHAFELHLTWVTGTITWPSEWTLGDAVPTATGEYLISGVTLDGGTNWKIAVMDAADTIVTDGLVLYLDAGIPASYPGSGTTWTDLAGSNNGTLTNGPTFSSANGGVIDFDGTNDYVNCGNDSSIDLTSSLTLEAWIYPDTFGSLDFGVRYGRIISKYSGSYQYDLRIQDSEQTLWFGRGSDVSLSASTNAISLGVWQHVAVTFDDVTNDVKFYIDGTLDSTTTSTATVSPIATPLIIGNINTGSLSRYFDGKIPVIRIYNRALSAAEITQNFEATRNRFGI